MTITPAEHWRRLLRTELVAARKARDDVRVSALRSALSTVDNAETPQDARVSAPASTVIGGAVAGLGSTEVPRRELSDQQIRSLLRAEVDAWLHTARDLTESGFAEPADRLRREAEVLAALPGV